MENERKLEIGVGFFVLLAVLVLVFGVIWGRGPFFYSKFLRIDARFADVRGLESGDPVMIRGTEQGRVVSVGLDGQSARVTLRLREDILLFSDAEIWIADRDLMGGKQVTIDPGASGRFLDTGRIIDGVERGDFLTMTGQAETLLRRLDETVTLIRPVFASGQIEGTVGDLRETARRAGETLDEIRPYWEKTSRRIEAASRQLENDSTLAHIGRVTGEMEAALAQIQILTRKMNREEGTFDLLIRDRELYDQLLRTTHKMDSLVTDIKAHPKRYLHFSLF